MKEAIQVVKRSKSSRSDAGSRPSAVKRAGTRSRDGIADRTGARVKGIVEQATTRTAMSERRLREQTRKQMDRARRTLDRADRKVSGYIRNNPKKAVAIAAGVGAAVAAAVAAAMRRR